MSLFNGLNPRSRDQGRRKKDINKLVLFQTRPPAQSGRLLYRTNKTKDTVTFSRTQHRIAN